MANLGLYLSKMIDKSVKMWYFDDPRKKRGLLFVAKGLHFVRVD